MQAAVRRPQQLLARKGKGLMSNTKDIREVVDAELIFDPLVDASNISVKNINGDVALNGSVPSHPQYLEAATAAQHVAGVKHWPRRTSHSATPTVGISTASSLVVNKQLLIPGHGRDSRCLS